MNQYRYPQEELCPGCGRTEGVELTRVTSRVCAWTCTRCGLNWAISVVNPHLRPDHPTDLAVAVRQLSAARAILTQIIVLAEEAPTITSAELRSRLLALAQCAR
ncbi:MAG TPA: hypothetical protein VGL88_05660 [Pseudonocardiaceae bacterium]